MLSHQLCMKTSTIMLTRRVRRGKVLFRPDFEPFLSLHAIRATSRCAVSSLCPTLLASPNFAGGGLGRARAASRRGLLFSRLWKNLPAFFDPIPQLIITAILVQTPIPPQGGEQSVIYFSH